MKKQALIFLGILLILFLAWAGFFYWKNLRGVKPALSGPDQDISTMLEKSDSLQPAENETGFPLELPSGFSIAVFGRVPEARDMEWDPYGNLLVSTREGGQIFSLRDMNGDGDAQDADETKTLLSGLNIPHGLATHCENEACFLSVAETNAVTRYEYANGVATNKQNILALPSGKGHNTRSLLIHGGLLYTATGSSCNVCVESEPYRATIVVSDLDGKNARVFASGLRNSVFLAEHPVTKKIWATEMGRDLIGDDIPPEEVNIIEEGKHYGWPYCYADRVHDSDFDPRGEQKTFCETTTPPHIAFQAHSAPLGLAFIPESWPADLRGDLLVSFHGSWNRSVPTGYKIVRFELDEQGNKVGEEDFLSGWLKGRDALGRPVDLIFDKDGALYISDDKAGLVYRASF